jgi:phosphatidylglycerol---prolipoprotein diacylglyceryl transferase
MSHFPFAYFVLNLDPILLRFGPFAVHWYGIAYVVAITIGLFVLMRWAHREGIHDDQIWGLFIWAAIGGLIGGRLYFVLQQPNLVQDYLLNPINILAVWNGGMAFFGAIFVGSAMLFILAPRYGLDRWIVLDGGALFAAVGQIFGRFGNIVNGDILGAAAGGAVTLPPGVCSNLNAACFAYVPDPHILPWALVYLNPNNTFVPLGVPFQPAQVYEILFNLVALALLWPLRHRLPKVRAGLFFTTYLMLYAISQFLVFFFRATEPTTPFLGISGLKQAQWTAIIVFLLCIPLALLIMRVSKPWPFSNTRPVPWPHFAPVDQQSPAHDPAANTLVAPPARHRGTINAGAPPPADLPPWQPTRPTGGRLRNLFGDMARSSSSQ